MYKLDRLQIVGPIGLDTPACVVREICMAHGIRYDDRLKNDINYHGLMVSILMRSKPITVQPPFEATDLQLISRFINPYQSALQWPEFNGRYYPGTFTLCQALDQYLNYSNWNNIIYTAGLTQIGPLTSDDILKWDSCISYSYCKKNRLTVSSNTSLSDMIHMIYTYSTTSSDLLTRQITSLLSQCNDRSHLITILTTLQNGHFRFRPTPPAEVVQPVPKNIPIHGAVVKAATETNNFNLVRQEVKLDDDKQHINSVDHKLTPSKSIQKSRQETKTEVVQSTEVSNLILTPIDQSAPQTESYNLVQPDSQTESHNLVQPDSQTKSHNLVQPDHQTESHNLVQPDPQTVSHNSVQPDSQTESHNSVQPDSQTEYHNLVQPDSQTVSHNLVQPDSQTKSHNLVQSDPISQQNVSPVKQTQLTNHTQPQPKIISPNNAKTELISKKEQKREDVNFSQPEIEELEYDPQYIHQDIDSIIDDCRESLEQVGISDNDQNEIIGSQYHRSMQRQLAKLPVEDHASAVVVSAVKYKLDFSQARNPMAEYQNLHRFSKNMKNYRPLDLKLQQKMIISRLFIDSPRLDIVFNPYFPIEMYTEECLIQLARGYDLQFNDQNGENIYTFLQRCSLVNMFYPGIGPVKIIGSQPQTETLVNCDNLDDIDWWEAVSYGSNNENFVIYTYQELYQTFEIEGYFKFLRTGPQDPKTYTIESIRRLLAVCLRTNYPGESDENRETRSRLARKITEILQVETKLEPKERELLQLYRNDDKKNYIKDAALKLCDIVMFIRGWPGRGPLPMTSKQTNGHKLEIVETRTNKAISNFYDVLNKDHEVRSAILSYPLFRFMDGRYNRYGDPDGGYNIGQRLEIMMGNRRDSIQPCIRLSSNYLAASYTRMCSILKITPRFKIKKLSTIA